MAIRNHPFFDNTDWFNLYLRKTKPPLHEYIANNIKSEIDLTNFDNLPDTEKVEKDDLTENELRFDDLDENEFGNEFPYCEGINVSMIANFWNIMLSPEI